MGENRGIGLAFAFGIAVGFAVSTLLIIWAGPASNLYKSGQVDAQNGKVYWHLEKQEDGTTKWRYREPESFALGEVKP